MLIKVEWLLTHTANIFDVARVPCVGEFLVLDPDEPVHEVKEVHHQLLVDPITQVQATVRAK